MKHYVQLSSQHYKDKDTGKIIVDSKRGHPFETEIPHYFWKDSIKEHIVTGLELKNGQLQNEYSSNKLCHDFTLNGIRIAFRDTDLEKRSWISNTDIVFYDNRKKERHSVQIVTDPELTLTQGRSKYLKLCSTSTQITFDGAKGYFVSRFDSSDNLKQLGIGYLAQTRIGKDSDYQVYNYGLRLAPYNISYRGRDLEGSCYAYIYGNWALLLQDNLSFDALVLLKGWNHEKLVIDKFIYTSNVYLIKVLSLWR